MKAKIRRITTENPVPVYDLHISTEYPCFALEAGIISHNTIPWDSELREIYTTRLPDSFNVHYDYSQNEIRCLAYMSGETALLKAFEDGIDVHRYIASKVWKCPPEEVTPGMRRYSKMASFSIIYGKSVEMFAVDFFRGDLTGARKLFTDFFTEFPRIRWFIEQRHAEVAQHGHVLTILKDPLVIPMHNPGKANRDAQNYPVQHAGSAIVADAIYELYKNVQKTHLTAVPLNFTHDSCDWEVSIRDLFSFIEMMHSSSVEYVKTKYGIPVAIDWELGIHQGLPMELKHLEDGTYHFVCAQHTFQDIVDRLSSHFNVEYTIDKEIDDYTSLQEMFIARRAFSKYVGEHIIKYDGHMSVTSKA